MTNSRVRIPGIRWVLAFTASAMLALAWAPAAVAQQDDQYDGTVAPSGPAAGETATVQGDEDGVVGPGDTIIIPGDFVVSEGASVTLQDSDGTQGTLIDGQNAEITEGSIIIQVTDFPVGVVGGDGVLDTDGLFVVATTGIFAAGGVDDADRTGADTGATAIAGAGAGAEASAGDATAGAGAGEDVSTQAGTGDGEGVSAQAGDGAAAAGAGAVAGDDAAASAGDDAVASEGAAEESAAVAVLPDTGGSIMALVLAGGLLLLGAGFLIRRFAGSN